MIKRLLFLYFLFAVSAAAQIKPTLRVEVRVEGEYSAEAESYVKQELHALGNVEVTDKNPTYTIRLIVGKLSSTRDENIGIAVSWITALHKPMDSEWVLIADHHMGSGGKDSLRKHCEAYIAKIDSEIFEPHRKLIQKAPNL
jgi:hypothetical protein